MEIRTKAVNMAILLSRHPHRAMIPVPYYRVKPGLVMVAN